MPTLKVDGQDVTVPQGAYSATFIATTTVVPGLKGVSVKATYGGGNLGTPAHPTKRSPSPLSFFRVSCFSCFRPDLDCTVAIKSLTYS